MFLTFPATNSQPRAIINLYQIVEVKEVTGPYEFRLEIYYLSGQEEKLRTYLYDNEKSLKQAFLDVSGHLGANHLSGGKFINKAGQ